MISPCTPGLVHLGDFEICCNTTTPPCQTDLVFYRGSATWCTGVWDMSGAIPFTVNNGSFTCGTPPDEVDLNVTNIYLNPGDTRANETLRVYVNQSNDVCAVVHNNGPDDVTDDFDVCFEVDGTQICCVTVDVSTLPGGVLAAGADTTVCCNWTPSCIDYPVMPGYPAQSLPFTINVTADCNCSNCPNCPDGTCGKITETDEANNTLSMYVPAIQLWSGVDRIGGVVNNAYKSRHCDCDTSDDPLSDYWVEYRDLTCGGLEWNVTGAELTLANGSTATRVHTIDLPSDASVKKAMLFVYWRDYWTNTNTYPSGCLADLSADMSSVCGTSPDPMPIEATYHDTKGFGKYNSPMGVYIYNVTDWTCTNGGNPVDYTVNVTNIDLNNQTKLMGQMMVVVYECDGDTLTHIWINEGVDYLMAADATHGSYKYHVSPEEATATIPFGGTDTIPDNICSATLTTVVGNGLNTGSNLLFNGGVKKYDAWDGTHEAYPGSKIEVEEEDVTSDFAVGSTNSMGFMDDTSNGFYAFNVFLVVTEKQSVPTATGLGDASFCVDKGCIENLTALNKGDVPGLPGNALFPYGLFSFNVTCLEPGATVAVTIKLPKTDPPVATYMKYNFTSGKWDDKVPATITGDTVTILLTDGGHYDRDRVVNGQISDPGGPISGAVQVSIDTCPAYICADPACRTTVNITLSGITDYGTGTIHLYYNPSVVEVDAIGKGDSDGFEATPIYPPATPPYVGTGHVKISAWNTGGVSGDVAFVNVTFRPTGNPGDCTDLDLTVEALYDLGYIALPTVVVNCTCPSGGLHIIESTPPIVTPPVATPAVILNDTIPWRARVQQIAAPFCTNETNLTVFITDATAITEVYVDLSPILGAGYEEVRMTGPDGAAAGTWYTVTNASYSSLIPYSLNVMANDPYDNWNNGSSFTLKVDRRGDVRSPTLAADNKVTGKDYYYIARYTVDREPAPEDCTAQVQPAASWDGVDMADALYIAMYVVGKGPAP